jgi:hypothetical protein
MNDRALSKRVKFNFLWIKPKRKPYNVDVVRLLPEKPSSSVLENIFGSPDLIKNK